MLICTRMVERVTKVQTKYYLRILPVGNCCRSAHNFLLTARKEVTILKTLLRINVPAPTVIILLP